MEELLQKNMGYFKGVFQDTNLEDDQNDFLESIDNQGEMYPCCREFFLVLKEKLGNNLKIAFESDFKEFVLKKKNEEKKKEIVENKKNEEEKKEIVENDQKIGKQLENEEERLIKIREGPEKELSSNVQMKIEEKFKWKGEEQIIKVSEEKGKKKEKSSKSKNKNEERPEQEKNSNSQMKIDKKIEEEREEKQKKSKSKNNNEEEPEPLPNSNFRMKNEEKIERKKQEQKNVNEEKQKKLKKSSKSKNNNEKRPEPGQNQNSNLRMKIDEVEILEIVEKKQKSNSILSDIDESSPEREQNSSFPSKANFSLISNPRKEVCCKFFEIMQNNPKTPYPKLNRKFKDQNPEIGTDLLSILKRFHECCLANAQSAFEEVYDNFEVSEKQKSREKKAAPVVRKSQVRAFLKENYDNIDDPIGQPVNIPNLQENKGKSGKQEKVLPAKTEELAIEDVKAIVLITNKDDLEGVRKFFKSIDKDFKLFFDELLSQRQYCIPNTEFMFCDKEVKINDTLGEWGFKFFFGVCRLKIMRTTGLFKTSSWIIPKNPDKRGRIQIEYTLNQSEDITNDENMDIDTFFSNFAAKNNLKALVIDLQEAITKQEIRTVKDFKRALSGNDNRVLDTFFGLKMQLLEELKTYDDLAKIPEKPNDSVEKARVRLLGNLHRIKRYIYYTLRKINSVAYLDKECLEETNRFIRKEYSNDELLDRIHDFYYPLTKPKDLMKNYSLPRGILFYGPPGTGKTTVAEKFPDFIGLTAINFPIASTEVIRGIVGETEKLLRELCERARLVPHLLCYLSVDEIDSIVPRRDNKENQNKGDAVATLLSLIGGIKDVPNLVFIASTNFMKKIDEAFSRRMSGKYFVGRLDKIGRMTMLQNVLTIEYGTLLQELKELRNANEEKGVKQKKADKYLKLPQKKQKEGLGFSVVSAFSANLEKIDPTKKFPIVNDNDLEPLNSLLINFTPAAIKGLTSEFISHFLKKLNLKWSENPDPGNFGNYAYTSQLDADDLVEISIKIAKQHNIRFGNFYIPELVTLDSLAGISFQLQEKFKGIGNSAFQGLVIADIKNKQYSFKLKDAKKTYFEDIQMRGNIYDLKDALPEIIKFAFDNSILSMQLIDLQGIINNGGHEENKVFEVVSECVAELKEYGKSMLVINLDSLVGVNTSQSDSMGKSYSYSISNIKLFDYLKSIANEDSRVLYSKNEIKSAFWVFVVVKNSYLLETLLNSINIEKSKAQQKREEEEQKKENEPQKCVRCEKFFAEKDNKNFDGCNYHMGYLFDSSLNPDEWELVDYLEEDVRLMIESTNIQKNKKTKDLDFLSESSEENDDSSQKSEGSYKKKKKKKNGKEEENNDKNPFVYVCCRKNFGEQGCINRKHSSNLEEFIEKREKAKENLEEVLEKLKNIKRQSHDLILN